MPPAAGELCAAEVSVPDTPSAAKDFEHTHLQGRQDAEAMLRMLVALFPETSLQGCKALSSHFTWIRPEDVPANVSLSTLSYRKSLVHEEHLTKILQDELNGEEQQ